MAIRREKKEKDESEAKRMRSYKGKTEITRYKKVQILNRLSSNLANLVRATVFQKCYHDLLTDIVIVQS